MTRTRGLKSVNAVVIDSEPPEPLRPFHLQEVIAEKERELAELQGFTAVQNLLSDREAQLTAEKDRFLRLRDDYQHNLALLDDRDSLIARLQVELKEQTATAQRQEEELRAAMGDREQWEHAKLELEGVKVASSETIARMKADILQLEHKYDQLLQEARSECASAVSHASDCQKSCESKAQEAGALAGELKSTKAARDEAETRLQVSTATLKEADLRIQQLEHELERQKIQFQEASETQLKKDVLTVKKYYETQIDKLRRDLREDYELKYAQVVDSVKGMEGLFEQQKQQQAARQLESEAEAERWMQQAEDLQAQLRQAQRQLKALQEDVERAAREREAVVDLAERRLAREAAEAASRSPAALHATQNQLLDDLKAQLTKAVEEREAAREAARELRAHADRLSLSSEQTALRLKECEAEVTQLACRCEQAETLQRRSEELNHELYKQVDSGLMMAQLAHGYVDLAAASAKARIAVMTSDADGAVDEQLSLVQLKAVVHRCTEGLQRHARADLRVTEDEANRMATDAKLLHAELQRCAQRQAERGDLGSNLRETCKTLKEKLARRSRQLKDCQRVMAAHGIAVDPPEPRRLKRGKGSTRPLGRGSGTAAAATEAMGERTQAGGLRGSPVIVGERQRSGVRRMAWDHSSQLTADSTSSGHGVDASLSGNGSGDESAASSGRSDISTLPYSNSSAEPRRLRAMHHRFPGCVATNVAERRRGELQRLLSTAQKAVAHRAAARAEAELAGVECGDGQSPAMGPADFTGLSHRILAGIGSPQAGQRPREAVPSGLPGSSNRRRGGTVSKATTRSTSPRPPASTRPRDVADSGGRRRHSRPQPSPGRGQPPACRVQRGAAQARTTATAAGSLFMASLPEARRWSDAELGLLD